MAYIYVAVGERKQGDRSSRQFVNDDWERSGWRLASSVTDSVSGVWGFCREGWVVAGGGSLCVAGAGAAAETVSTAPAVTVRVTHSPGDWLAPCDSEFGRTQ